MSFRTKLLIAFVVTVVLAVAVVSWTVSATTRRTFEERDAQRTSALVAQFQREFDRRGEDVVRRVEGVIESETTLRMAIDLARPDSDASLYVSDAIGLSKSYRLDFVELVSDDGRIISSAQWPARFGYPNDWVTKELDWKTEGAFLKREELPDGLALALVAVRTVNVGEKKLYIIGGQRLDKEFLASLVLPEGMRAMLYRDLEPAFNAASLTDASGPVDQADKLAAFIEQVRRLSADMPDRTATSIVTWGADPISAETFHAIPLRGRTRELLGVLLVGSSRREIVVLNRQIQSTAFLVGAGGVLFGFILSWWASARVTRPVKKLAESAREVAAGHWNTRVQDQGRDEIGELARTFNQMTQQLVEQRERLVQTERVAAWRELARRLAHELKNPLFPLQITIENLQRAREQTPAEFDEVFRESTATLLAELDKLKGIIGRFSDFAKMPAPDLKSVNVNEIVRSAVKLFDAQFGASGRPVISPELYLQEDIGTIQADADLLHRAIQNLVLNAMDAMPAGGTLTLRSKRITNGVQIEIADTGTGLTREECERLFTPYYTTKHYGTGLGLAIVQSVVSDHHGRIFVESEPGRGTTFRITLPKNPSSIVGRPEKIHVVTLPPEAVVPPVAAISAAPALAELAMEQPAAESPIAEPAPEEMPPIVPVHAEPAQEALFETQPQQTLFAAASEEPGATQHSEAAAGEPIPEAVAAQPLDEIRELVEDALSSEEEISTEVQPGGWVEATESVEPAEQAPAPEEPPLYEPELLPKEKKGFFLFRWFR